MYVLEKIKNNIAKKINKALGDDLVQAFDFVYPPNSGFGDFCLNVFFLINKLIKTPNDITHDLVCKIKTDKIISKIINVGPYINFEVSREYLAKNVISEIKDKKEEFGKNKNGKNKKVMVEYTNANTHKEFHIGHLRNLCYGDSVQRIIGANGYKSIPVSYINDFGIHVAKTLWAYLEYFKDEKLPENKGYFLGKTYVRAASELKEDEGKKQLVQFMMKKIESRKGEEYDLWQKTREWSIEQFEKIYEEMGVKLENIFYESEFIEKGLKMIPKLIKDGILEKSQGAVIANLEKYNLGVLVILRSDGTATYPVADLPLAKEKIEKYKLNKSIYVVDVRQALYFKQLFKILDLLGFKQDMLHLGYEFVKLPSGMMSSRSGNVITYEELKEEMMKECILETKKRHKDWDDKKISEIAMKIAIGAIKFEMIKVGANNIITFDTKKALEFSGYTSAYLQYSYARICSINKKVEVKSKKLDINFSKLNEDPEHGLILKLAKYPEIVDRAGKKYDPSEIAKYLFELAQMFNDYYHAVPILKAEKEVMEARLALISSIARVLENGLELLGIDVLEEM